MTWTVTTQLPAPSIVLREGPQKTKTRSKIPQTTMYKGIENEIEFSGSQLVGATFAAQYMEAVSQLEKFKNNLPIDQNLWSAAQKEKKIKLMEVVQHYRSMPLILEFNKLIADLQGRKKEHAPKRVTFLEDKYQRPAPTSRDTFLDLPHYPPRRRLHVRQP